MKRLPIKVLIISALLVALSVILGRFASIRIPIGGVEALRIGFGTFPIILAGFLYGPWVGGIVGALSNILGFILIPVGGFMPHFVVVSALGGVFPILFFRLFGSSWTYWGLLLAIGLSLGINGILFISYLMNSLYGTPYSYILPGRILAWVVTAPIYPLLMLRIWPLISKER